MDLFVVPTIGFKLLYGFVIVRLPRRDLVWINVTANPTAEWVARQITEAFPWDGAPGYMIRDRDRIYGAVVTRRLRAMGIRDKPIAPASPWQNGFAERLIGSIRRECLDHIIVLGEVHLRRNLISYAAYYNSVRTHRSLHKDAPISRPVQQTGIIRSRPDPRRASPSLRPGLSFRYTQVKYLNEVIFHLEKNDGDPKLDTCIYFLEEKGWLEDGCIIFSQYYDTAHWVAEKLSHHFPGETVAVYGGAGRSGIFLDGEWRTAKRENIKDAVREYKIRLVVATDAAAEGLNLQTLTSLINVDLPWNPSRLEQRIGRIKRYGQKRDRVNMANLVYQNTVDEKVYDKLSSRMKDRYDLLGSLPDVIDDEWIDNVEAFEEGLREFTRKKKNTADVFELRYGNFLQDDGSSWQLCEKVLDRDETEKILSTGW
jgi:hypothetical protein